MEIDDILFIKLLSIFSASHRLTINLTCVWLLGCKLVCLMFATTAEENKKKLRKVMLRQSTSLCMTPGSP